MRARQVFYMYDKNKCSSPELYKYCPLCGCELVFGKHDGQDRFHCPCCHYVHYKNPYPGVVVLIEREGMVLLGKRSGHNGRGKWCLPGGFIEFEEDFLTAAHREIKEETGLDIEIQSILSVVTNYISPQLHTIVVVLKATPCGGVIKADDDICELGWFPLQGPLPDMAFPADTHIIERYWRTGFDGVPVDSELIHKTVNLYNSNI